MALVTRVWSTQLCSSSVDVKAPFLMALLILALACVHQMHFTFIRIFGITTRQLNLLAILHIKHVKFLVLIHWITRFYVIEVKHFENVYNFVIMQIR